MIVTCGGCGSRFHMNPALFQGARGVRIRCRRCGERIKVLNPEAPPESSPTPELAVPEVSRSIEAGPTTIPEPAGAESPEPAKEPARGPDATPSPGFVAETAAPADPGERRKALIEGPALEQGDAVPWAEPTQPDIPPWLVAGPDPGAPPGTGSEAEAETATIRFATEGQPPEGAARVRHPGRSDRRSPLRLAVLLAVAGIFLLVGGAFLFRDARSARNLLRNLFPPSGPEKTAGVVTPAGAEGKPAYEIRGMESFHAEAFKGGKLFVIQGTVANVGKGASRGILLRATLIGADNQALADNVVYAGNRVDNTTLRHADREVIRKILTVRDGAGNANREIPAGSSLPFMTVFFDPPEPFESFAVTAADAE